MKKIIPVILIAGFALSACSDSGKTNTATETQIVTQTVQSTTTKAQESQPVESIEDRYIRELDKQNIEYGSKENGLRAGIATCNFMKDGNTPRSLFEEMAQNPHIQVLPGIPNDDLPRLMGIAVGVICPEYAYMIKL